MSAEELDGPGAIVSHAEVLEAWQDGARRPVDIARGLGVSSSTASRLLANLRRAGLLESDSNALESGAGSCRREAVGSLHRPRTGGPRAA